MAPAAPAERARPGLLPLQAVPSLRWPVADQHLVHRAYTEGLLPGKLLLVLLLPGLPLGVVQHVPIHRVRPLVLPVKRDQRDLDARPRLDRAEDVRRALERERLVGRLDARGDLVDLGNDDREGPARLDRRAEHQRPVEDRQLAGIVAKTLGAQAHGHADLDHVAGFPRA